MNITIGEEAVLSTSLASVSASGGSVAADDPSLELLILAPDGSAVTLQQPTRVIRTSLSQYEAHYLPDKLGVYRWRWTSTQNVQGAAEGTFEVISMYQGAVTDIRDLRVLVPACRRAIDGPQATAPDAPSTSLADNEVLGLIADATATLILHTASRDGSDLNAFGNQLVVVSRDPFYQAPDAWMTDVPRSTAQDAAILSQAALDHYFWMIKLLKVSETQKNEAVEWQYSLSANVIASWVKYLQENRDKAISALQTINPVLDSYVSLVAERDRLSAAWLEPWVTEIGAPVPYVGGGGSGPLEYDYRFNTWG